MGKRSYGTGRLFARCDSGGREVWYGTWWAGGVRVKRRIGLKRSTGRADGLTRVQAERELRRRIETDVVIAGAQLRTVAEAGEAYIEHLEFVMERKRTTVADYRGYLCRHLAPFFGERPLDRIDAARVEAFLRAKRTSGLSSKTVCNQLNFLHGLFAFAIKRGWASSNPVALVDRPRTPRHSHRRIRFLQREELDALLRAVPDDHLGAVERPLYLCAAMTGLRQGELIGLRWTDVDWTASRVRVAESYTRGAFDSPKSHRGRSVPMADRLAGELELHFQRSRFQADADLVFAHPITGHVLDASKLRKRFYDALDRAELHRLTFHELRHTFGTQIGRRRRSATRDPGMDGARRRQHDRDLLALRARSVAWGRVRAAGVRGRRHGRRPVGRGQRRPATARALTALVRDPSARGRSAGTARAGRRGCRGAGRRAPRHRSTRRGRRGVPLPRAA